MPSQEGLPIPWRNLDGRLCWPIAVCRAVDPGRHRDAPDVRIARPAAYDIGRITKLVPAALELRQSFHHP